jgi:hypothetical protein
MMYSLPLPRPQLPNLIKTRGHVLRAGQEIAWAAQTALALCKSYSQEVPHPSTRRHLGRILDQALRFTSDLTQGLHEAAMPTMHRTTSKRRTVKSASRRPTKRNRSRRSS